jgi:hypothetical protein
VALHVLDNVFRHNLALEVSEFMPLTNPS